MPRTKRAERFITLTCSQCESEFKCVREDAKTCSVKCRQQWSRELRAARRGRDMAKSLNAKGKIECGQCGSKIDGRAAKCPVCGAKRKKPHRA